MKRFIKRKISDKTIIFYTKFLKKISKTLAVIVIVALFSTYVPWDLMKVSAEDTVSSENSNNETKEQKVKYSDKEIDPSLIPISFEDVEKRTATEKHFRKVDGTYEAVIYDHAVNYFEDGVWKEIDNSLVDSDQGYENKSNNIKVKFPNKLDDNKSITVKYDQYQISWNIINSNRSDINITSPEKVDSTNIKNASKSIQSVEYKNIFNNVDLEYSIIGNSVKENFILNEFISDFSITINIDTKGLNLIEREGVLVFINDKGEEIFSFGNLEMYDNEGKISCKIDYQFSELKKDNYQLIITPNNEWLSEAKYPVTVDPSLNNSTTTMSIYDTYISSIYPNQAFNTSSFMRIGNCNEPSIGVNYGLIYFYIPSSIMNQTITYSHLALTNRSSYANAQINLYKNKRIFDDTITRGDWSPTDPLCDNNVVDYHIYSGSNKFIYDITKSVKEWQATGNTRTTGFTLKDNDYTYSSSVELYTMESTAENRPLITIGYEEPAGLKDYWTYTSQDMGMVGTGYITDYTGNLTFVRNDFAFENEFMSFSLDFIYSVSNRNNNIGFGYGWETNYNMRIKTDTAINRYYLLKPDGNKIYFMDTDVANNYIAEDGSGMEYIRDNSSQYSNMLTKDNIKYSFGNTDGKLYFITNLVTNKTLSITYYFADHIWHVDDATGNKIQFYYDSSWKVNKTQLQLKKSDGTFRVVEEKRYYYDSYGNIDYIEQDFNYGTEPSTIATGPTLQYTFNPTMHLLKEAYNTSDNYKVYYTYYYSSYYKIYNFRLKDINDGEEVILEYTSIQYLYHETIYTDIHGYNIKYIFDYWGHTVNVIDSFGNAAFYKYSNPFTCYLDSSGSNNLFDIINEAPDYYNNHKLLESSEPLKQQFNYIQNHGFEECNKNWTIGPYGIIDYSSSEKILGNYSLSLANYVTYGSYAYQDITLDSGSYTIQGWIKNDSSTNGAYIEIFNADTIISSSLPITGTEWKRYDLKFELENPKTISVRLWNTSISTAYFDNVQLVEGLVDEDIDYFIDSRYNIITDNSFENSSALWELSSGATIESIPNPSDFMHPILGEKAVCINGDSQTIRYVSQTFNPDTIMGNGLTFVIGGWAQSSNAVPNKSYYDGAITSDERFFGLKIILEVAQDPLALENTDTLTYYFPFDPSIEDWQYIMKTISIPDYLYCDQIIIEGIYQGEGKAYFDDFQIYYDRINTEYSYNSNGNLTDVSKPSGEQISYGYDSNNQIITITTRDIITTANYDGLLMNNIIRNNVFVAFNYNPANQLDETQYGKPLEGKWFTTTTKYTTDGQYVSKTIDEFGNEVNYTTDQSISAITEIIDTLGTTQDFIYNSYGQLTSTIKTASDGTSIGCSYDYKSDGKLQYITRNGVVYEVVYDDLDRITNLKVANDVTVTNAYIGDEESDYSKSNLLEKQTYGNGYEIKFVYDNEDRIKEVQEKVSEETYIARFEYEYDSSGKLCIFKDYVNDNTYYYSYDLVGKLKNIIDQNSNEISYGYDSQGNVNHYTYVIEGCEREFDYNYDNLTGLYDQTSYGGVEKKYYYDDDSLSRLNHIELLFASTTLTKEYHYEEDDVVYGTTSTRVCSIVYKKNTSTQMVYSYHYYKNNIDDILVTLENGTILEHYSYVYDGFNELIRENYDDGTTSFTKLYTYDENGNIKTIKKYAYTLDDLDEEDVPLELISFDYISDRIIKITTNGVENDAFTYDEIGNLLTDGTNSYTWNGKELIQVQTNSGTYNYQYNNQGIRTQKEEVNGAITKYYLDGDKVLVEINNNDTIYYAYDVDGSLISMNLNGIEYYYVTNMQGDIIELVAGDGTIVVSYKYDAWGNIIGTPYDISNVDLANKNPYRYRGYRYDNETGFYYLQSRYYNPEIGRFISADSFIGRQGDILSHNMYSYCENNPIMNYDPNGNFAWAIPGAIIGGIIGGVVGGIISYKKTGHINWWAVAGGAAAGALIGAGAGYLAQTILSSSVATTATVEVGTSLTAAASADGDPTNEVIKVGEYISTVGTYLGEEAPRVDWVASSLHLGMRMSERNINTVQIYDTLNNGICFSQWNGNRYLYITHQTCVVTTKLGEVITTWGESSFGENIKRIIEIFFGG